MIRSGEKIAEKKVWDWLGEIPDPEIPVVNILELGIVRSLEIIDLDADNEIQSVKIGITPTYSGCPAMDMISMQIRMKLLSHGVGQVEIFEILQPAWTTDWITEEARVKMQQYGIAPPQRKSREDLALFEEESIQCPLCKSYHTLEISRFGSTSCKAMYQCLDCKEPFEHFKCH